MHKTQTVLIVNQNNNNILFNFNTNNLNNLT